ncbi:peptidylprolyl isomerase [Thermosynechococcus sp. JY1334]|uniref:peptidylprolyl isomerase n=1 Tax=unclassified Thermosynechococcus TaxID=2622553 RepID=UPI00267163E5|nr:MULTISPECIES: peptidylprolyl isomerase [unclassified Thermosynechococcus]MDR7898736.1 peptidylprolyl isomerase [Thermosynechococcus sp. JY1332]MDR7906140.1 peptidylprolyl isomerase [Thermosynechococcus sp. JY1334]MDR7993959.1 peptidylprolyl isomerase [Thermosynechococcus sp. TG252]WKT85867.1 peptidylprolyl isomerase [Thermosynechococcus sp. JY1339]WNC54811.1 peptidylprolyl isomerase [Thermosynechococcus sp. JY1331]
MKNSPLEGDRPVRYTGGRRSWEETVKRRKRWLAVLVILLLWLGTFLLPPLAIALPVDHPLIAALPQGNAITDPKALLRWALPIDNPTVRELQKDLEQISFWVRGKQWSKIASNISKAKAIVRDRADELLKSIPAEKQEAAKTLLAELETSLDTLQEAAKAKDRSQLLPAKAAALDKVGDLEAMMVQNVSYTPPKDYEHLPRLLGRATVAMETTKGNLTIVVDGYSAPLTAGNFVDLVQRHFYDGLPFTRAEESYVLQAGDPPGPEVGFIDPETNQYRAIPLEILVEGDKYPLYGITLEDAGRYLEHPVLPFAAYGTVALARPSDDPNGGSSQFFFLLFEPELTPAGLNLLDGRYAVFGYVVEGEETLRQLRQGDKILSAKVVDGLENLVQPA